MTHDYTRRYLGHDFTITKVIDGGQRLLMCGWGHGLSEGHFLVLPNEGATTRYRLDRVSYFTDPSDMWSADVSFAPRPLAEPAHA